MFIRIFAGGNGRWGLGHDSRLVESVLKQVRLGMRNAVKAGADWKIEHCDPVTWGNRTTPADLHIYLETPCRMAFPWASYNVVVVNPEWWPVQNWDWCFAEPKEGGADLFVFKCRSVMTDLFRNIPEKRKVCIPWKTDIVPQHNWWSDREDRFLYVIGGSPNKTIAARTVVAAWKPEWPPLEIWCAPAIAEELRGYCGAGLEENGSIVFQTVYKSAQEKERRQLQCKWHIVASAAEGYGFTMAEAAAVGAPVVWTDLPVLSETWRLKHGRIPTYIAEFGDVAPLRSANPENHVPMREPHQLFREEDVAGAVEEVIGLTADQVKILQDHYRDRITENRDAFLTGWRKVVVDRLTKDRHMPFLPAPMPKGAPVPKVGLITVTRNRSAWWSNMVGGVMNALKTWPVNRLEWIIVDDSDAAERIGDRVARLQQDLPTLSIKYMPLEYVETVGTKRNMAVAAASADVDVFACMDDDDHYPPGSLERRVPWITTTDKQAVYCSSLPMYDITRYVSAMNVPPLILSPAKRISEATLTFTRRFWQERPFADSNMAEGDGFVEGRWKDTVEIPPYGIIVSFIHKGNSSSRRTPADQEPNGSHYGFSDKYFEYIHEIGGLEEE